MEEEIIRGNDFNLFLEITIQGKQVSLPLCSASSFSMTVNRETKEAVPNFTNKGLWRQYYYGVADYSIDLSGIVKTITKDDYSKVLLGVVGGVMGSDGSEVSIEDIYNVVDSRYYDLEDALLNSKTLNWAATDGETIKYSGQVLVSTINHSSATNDINRFSTTLQGTGEYSKTLLTIKNG